MKSFLLTFIYLSMVVAGRAQVGSLPPAARAYANVTFAFPMSAKDERWLVDAYKVQDSLVYLRTKLRPSVSDLVWYRDSLGWEIEKALLQRLPKEDSIRFVKEVIHRRAMPPPYYGHRFYRGADLSTKFGLAIRKGDSLQLTESQYIKLYASAADLGVRLQKSREAPETGWFDAAAFESAALEKLLTESQLHRLIAIKNRERAMHAAQYAWHALKSEGLSGGFQKDSSIHKLTVYYAIRYHLEDAFAHNREKLRSLLRTLRPPEPLAVLLQSKKSAEAKLEKYAW